MTDAEDHRCPHAVLCALFPRFTSSVALKTWQVLYCEADYSRCVRYQASLRGEEPPIDLLPNGKTLELPPEGSS